MPTTVKRKYYVAAQQILVNDWAQATMSETIQKAARILESEPRREYVVISQIVKIVKRKEAPIVVEDVE